MSRKRMSKRDVEWKRWIRRKVRRLNAIAAAKGGAAAPETSAPPPKTWDEWAEREARKLQES